MALAWLGECFKISRRKNVSLPLQQKDSTIAPCICTQNKGVIWAVSTLTHWGRVTHICVSKTTIIGSDNGLSPGRRQAIIWTNAGILLIGTLGANFSEILIECHSFSFKKMHMKMSSGKWRPSFLGLNVLTNHYSVSAFYSYLAQKYMMIFHDIEISKDTEVFVIKDIPEINARLKPREPRFAYDLFLSLSIVTIFVTRHGCALCNISHQWATAMNIANNFRVPLVNNYITISWCQNKNMRRSVHQNKEILLNQNMSKHNAIFDM